MSKRSMLVKATVYAVVALTMASHLPAAAADDPHPATVQPDTPAPETISAVVRNECLLHLQTYELVSDSPLAQDAATAYARCAVSAVDASGVLAPLFHACEAYVVAERGACLIEESRGGGIGEQVGALTEACTVAGVGVGSLCSDLADITMNDCVNVVRCLVWVESWTQISNPADGAKPCSGARAHVEASATNVGGAVHFGGFVGWFNKVHATVAVSVTWEAQCEVLGEVVASGGGGFLRAVRATRGGGEAYPLCDYDGLIEWECLGVHSNPESFYDDGAYDADEDDGTQPLSQLTAKILPDFQATNTFQGSLRFVEIFDPASAVPEKAERVLNVYYEGGLPHAADMMLDFPALEGVE